MLAYKVPREGTVHYDSSLSAVLRDARRVTGREPKSGAVLPDKVDLVGSWLGAIAYMTMFDMVGSIFRPFDSPDVKDTEIGLALQRFAPGIEEVEREALYALRCSFMHNFSLVNIGKGRDERLRQLRTHHFYLDDNDNGGVVVTLPREKWTGDFEKTPSRSVTHVNLRSLGDLAESVARKMIELHEVGKLKISLAGGVQEFVCRYGMTIYPDLKILNT